MNKLQEYNLRIEHSEAEDREPIDFDVRDLETDERYATVWGSEPWHDIQCECEHPEHLVEFGDIDERGECPICGATCDWGWVKDVDEGRDEEGNYTAREIEVREIGEWHTEELGGVIGDYIKQLRKEF